jgi:hypothetical protein
LDRLAERSQIVALVDALRARRTSR